MGDIAGTNASECVACVVARVYLVGGKGRQPPQVEHEQFDNSCFSVGQEKLFQQPKYVR